MKKIQKIQKVILSNRIQIQEPVLFSDYLRKAFTIINPKYTNSCRYSNSRFKPKKYIYHWESDKNGIYIPRGSLTKIQNIYKKKGVKLKIVDKTKLLKEIPFEFKGSLDKSRGQLSIKKWKKNFGILKAPTGSGKTVMFSWLMANVFKQPTIISVHTGVLLEQWPKRLNQFLGISIKDIGIIGESRMEVKPVTIALMQTLVKHPDVLKNFSVLCIDECFVKGTLVDGIPIENIKKGDKVRTYNHKTKKIEFKKVINVFKSKPNSLCTTTLSNGVTITSTENHPFYTKENNIKKYSLPYYFNKSTMVCSTVQPLLNKKGEQNEKNHWKTTDSVCTMCNMWKNSILQIRKSILVFFTSCKTWKSCLFSKMQTNQYRKCKEKICKISKRIQQNTFFKENEKEQPNEQSKEYRKNDDYKKNKWNIKCLVRYSWWKWTINKATETISNCIRMENGSGCTISGKCTNWEKGNVVKEEKITNLLQNRYRKQKIKNRNRNRWKGAQYKNKKIKRSEKNKSIKWIRMENITFHKQTSNETFGDMCKGGYVYNIEVKDNHNYFVENILVHNCHRAPCGTYTTIINNFFGKYLIGLSATPRRADGLTSVMKWFVGGIHVDIKLKNVELCKCYYKIILTKFLAEKCFQQKYSSALVELARNQERNKLIIKNVLKNIEHPGVHLIISQNRMHCTKLFKLLPKHIRLVTEVLTGKVTKKERKRIVLKAEKGKLKILIATDKLIGEGFDLNILSVGHQTTPISNKDRLIQYLGRIRRISKEKTYAIWFDYFDVNEPVLRKGAKKRVAAYKENGIIKM